MQELVVPEGFAAFLSASDGVPLQLFPHTRVRLPQKWPPGESPLFVQEGQVVILAPGQQKIQLRMKLGPLDGQLVLVSPGAAVVCQVKYERPLGSDLSTQQALAVVRLYCVHGTLLWIDSQGNQFQTSKGGQILLRVDQPPQVESQAPTLSSQPLAQLDELQRQGAEKLHRIFSEELTPESEKDVETLLREIATEHRNIEVRYLALVHLAELGVLDPLIDALADPRYQTGNFWEKLLDYLYAHASFSSEVAQQVRQIMIEQFGREVGQRAFRLLQGYAVQALKNPDIAQEVLVDLQHSELAVRRLALWMLKRTTGETNTSYNPHRFSPRGVQEWRRRLERLRRTHAGK